MKEMIGYCGIDCSKCPGYLATLHDSDEERCEVAKTWSEMYGLELLPQHINCTGCMGEKGPKIPYCSSCEIRRCAHDNKIDSCIHCDSYPCQLLEIFLRGEPEARKNLETRIQREREGNIK